MRAEPLNIDAMWDSWQQDWQSTAPAVDVAALVRKADQRRKRMIALQILEVVLVTGATVMFAFLHGKPGILLPWPLLPLMWIALAVKTWMRHGHWRAQGTDAAALLDLVQRRARRGLQFIWLEWIGLLAIYAILAIPVANIWIQDTLRAHVEVLTLIVMQGIIVLCLAIWSIWYALRQRKTLRQIQPLLDQQHDNP